MGEPVPELGERRELAVQQLPDRSGMDAPGVMCRGVQPRHLVSSEAALDGPAHRCPSLLLPTPGGGANAPSRQTPREGDA